MAKILIIDDERGICEEFRDILEDEDHEVDTVMSGQEGLERIAVKNYDLVFLDVLMPKMEGREVFEKIKQMRQDLPVAIMSGYIPSHKRDEVLKLGAAACFRKPLNLGKVRDLIESVVSKKSS